MSWYQSVAGAEVPLSPSVQQRIGVSGFGVDDVGVIRNPRMLAAVLKIGQQVGAIEDKAISAFLAVENGSGEQINEANALGRKSLTGLRSWIDKNVATKLAGVPGMDGELYATYSKWARESGWELPVGCLENYPYRCFSIADEGGLSVFDCTVNKVPGAIGDVLVTLVDELVINALKVPAIAAIQWSMMMGFESGQLSKHKGFEEMRGADGRTVLNWLQKVESDMCEEMSYWNDDEEAMNDLACQMRDIAFAEFDEERRIERVVGDTRKNRLRDRRAYMERIKQAAERCEESALRDFALMVCESLEGESTGEMIQRLPADERFERIPGDWSLVDTGIAVDDINHYYNNINEVAQNGDDVALLPLERAPELVVEILCRITLCERLIIALGALLDDQEQLSKAEAA